jgi:8-hydroxy-5-deazaflavin:NADPH oxidoreductase
MKVAVLGRGNVGGGLADLWEQASHQVTRISARNASADGLPG